MKRLFIISAFIFITSLSHANQIKIVDIEYDKFTIEKYYHHYYLINNQNSDSGYYEINYQGKKKKKNIIVNNFALNPFDGPVNKFEIKTHYLNLRKINKYRTLLIFSWALIFPVGTSIGIGGIFILDSIIPAMITNTNIFAGIALSIPAFFGVAMALVGAAAILIPIIFSLVFGIKHHQLTKTNQRIIENLLVQINDGKNTEITVFKKRL